MMLGVHHVGFYLSLASVRVCLYCTELFGFEFSRSTRFCACVSFPCTQPREGVLIRMDQGQGCLLGHSTSLWNLGVIREWVRGLNFQWSHFSFFLPRKLVFPCRGRVVAGQTRSRPYKETLVFFSFPLAHLFSLINQSDRMKRRLRRGLGIRCTWPLSGLDIKSSTNMGFGAKTSG